jgi:hypothetical protein
LLLILQKEIENNRHAIVIKMETGVIMS